MIEHVFLDEDKKIAFQKITYDPNQKYFIKPKIFVIGKEFYIFYKDKKVKLTDTKDRKYRFKLYKVLLFEDNLFEYIN
ncbi:MAG: hypothetical protein C0172_03045 [Caldisphaera sp.]|nr:MAG: hypothetical protein C0172_03045 [Caldisphaera sp.]